MQSVNVNEAVSYLFCAAEKVHNESDICIHLGFYVLVSDSVFTALSTVFHSINPPDNSPLSHSVLPVLFLLYWSFQQYNL